MNNPAERAAEQAFEQVRRCVDERKPFRLEAGAGAGKTHSLIQALQYVIKTQGPGLIRRRQKVACITYTNVAKAEIESRTDRHPSIYCDTVHGFCWSMIKDYQPQLRAELGRSETWKEKLEDVGGIGGRAVEYTLGYGVISDSTVSLYHSDVLALFVLLMRHEKFRSILAARYPIVFIDEYQDTDIGFADVLKNYCIGAAAGPLIGLFGDSWQKIYRGVCGTIDHPAVTTIAKGANFRSARAVVDVLNLMRPELPQEVVDPDSFGSVCVYHTNSWRGERRTEGHWKGDLPAAVAHDFLQHLKSKLSTEGWDLTPEKTKILMLTHNVLASEQGYSGLAAAFPYNDTYIKKEHPHIAFFADVLEPVCRAFESRRFGEMFSIMGSVPAIKSSKDKLDWSKDVEKLLAVRANGAVGEVVDLLRVSGHPPITEAMERMEREREATLQEPVDEGSRIDTLRKMRSVPYREVIALVRFLDGQTPFSTKHGVKGAEFDNVLVIVGRGWNLYNFSQMLELASGEKVPASKWDAFERARNLFYVCCSRPKKRLGVLFTQELSDKALATLRKWFGAEAVHEFNPS